MKLVIVESPTKARTISRFLGKEYRVESSYGHVRDLPKSKLGVDVDRDFSPTYVIPPKAKQVVAHLKNAAKKAEVVILATDEDREGEAIAWHIVQVLGLERDPKLQMHMNASKQIRGIRVNSDFSDRTQRISFHEITESAIKQALAHPRTINMALVDAQQARRVLDRLVGYKLSPFLWRKVRYGLSAGRVQSVAVRLVVEREREILSFVPQEYWTIVATLVKRRSQRTKQRTFEAVLQKIDGETLDKFALKSETDARRIVADLDGAAYRVLNIAKKETSRTPPPPFTTSTLQQEGARRLGLSAKETMLHAQRLYEKGFITYMRTDSVNVAASALTQARHVISDRFGEKYALSVPRAYTKKTKGAQEAHEAIRPTDLRLAADELPVRERKQRLLYDLIWKRMLASQMQMAQLEQTVVDIEAKNGERRAKSYIFRATGQVVKFDGFMRVYTEGRNLSTKLKAGDDSDQDPSTANRIEDDQRTLPPLEKDEPLDLERLTPLQHFTEPLPRYTDASLVKALEAHGVGRPSTYAPILSTIQERGYVEKIEKKYQPTEIGIIVNDLLVAHFPEIVDIGFTARIEEELDDIAEGKIGWVNVCREFYDPFKKHLTEKEASVEKHREESTTPCPHCGKMMIVKFGRAGKFLVCPDPENKFTMPLPEEAAKIKELEEKNRDEQCPLCGGPMNVKRSRFGYFLACRNYPNCKGVAKIWNKTGFKCPDCKEGDIVERKWRGRTFYGCNRYPSCAFATNKKPENEEDLTAALSVWKERQKNKRSDTDKPESKKYE